MDTRIEKVWLTAKQTQGCEYDSSGCFSCCYEQPGAVHGECLPALINPDGSCHDNRCCRENDIVLECGELLYSVNR